jgi:phosphoadenosine phosphosulfate reductase
MKPTLWQIPQADRSDTQVAQLYEKISERLAQICAKHQSVKFATSLAAEDMVITDAIVRGGFAIEIFTLNTGRLHQQTLDMLAQVEKHYGVRINVIEPIQSDVDHYIAQRGLNAFYESEQAKKACCEIRKVKPLNTALAGAQAWLTGQRRAQAVTRTALEFAELDESRGMEKYNPIFDFSDDDLWSYTLKRQVPIHPLHQVGYPSIGCEPCTRAIKAGEDIRAGRWWWLQQESKECGLHVVEEGKV